jgi:polyhydroxybutyrate depolymerase
MPGFIKLIFNCFLLTCLTNSALKAGEHPTAQTPQFLQVDGMGRAYLLYVPETEKARKMPLVIVLHGAGGTAAGMQQLTGFDALANEQKFIVAYPEGIDNKWNDGRGRNEQIDDVKFISELINAISSRYPVDSLRIYVTGISNGGFFTMRLACELSNRIAAVAAIGATVEEMIDQNCQSANPVSVLLIHGTKDPVVSIDGGKVARLPRSIILSHQEAISHWVHRDACNTTPVITNIPDSAHDGTFILKTVYQGGKNNTEVISYVISGGGHTWPGKEHQSLTLGKTSHNLDGTLEIWNFFKRHSK